MTGSTPSPKNVRLLSNRISLINFCQYIPIKRPLIYLLFYVHSNGQRALGDCDKHKTTRTKKAPRWELLYTLLLTQ
ncbi:MAG: hypothetical protein EA345_06350 [Halomonas sp.]|nr:MAG: hypothetical protein EA345_06350 [Halomonas sp.]